MSLHSLLHTKRAVQFYEPFVQSDDDDGDDDSFTHIEDETLVVNDVALESREDRLEADYDESNIDLSKKPLPPPLPPLCTPCERPNKYLVPFFYFSLGFVFAVPALALKYYYATVLHLSPATVSTIDGLVVLPWMVKPLFGLLSDTLPILGRHRMPYVFISSAVAASTWFMLASDGPWRSEVGWTIVLLLLGNMGICFSDVIIDTLLVGEARLEDVGHHGKVQSNAWIVRHAGSLIGSAVGAGMVGYTDVHLVFVVAGVMPTVLWLTSPMLQEPPRSRSDALLDGEINANKAEMPDIVDQWSCTRRIRTRMKSVREAVMKKGLWKLILFVFVFAATPSSGSAFFFFLVNEIGFTKKFMGWMEILSSASLLLGVASYRLFFRRVALRKMLFIAIIMSVALGSVQLILIFRLNRALGIDDHWFALSDEIVASFVSQLALMPLLTLAARVCPHGDEGTLYAGLMSVFNLAGITSNFSGSYMTSKLGVTQTNFDNLWVLSVSCTVCSLLPLAMLGLVPKSLDEIESAPDKPATS